MRPIVCMALSIAAFAASARSSEERWTPVGLSGGGGMHAPAISPHDPKLMLVSCDMNGLYRTTDGGASWSMVHYSQMRSHTYCRPLFHPTDPGVVFAANEHFDRSLRVSRDRGATWRPLTEKPPWPRERRIRELGADASNGEFLLVGLDDGAYATGDGGKTWWKCDGLGGAVTGFHVDQTSPRERRVCFAGTQAGVFRSDDGGKTWTPKHEGLPLDQTTRKTSGTRIGWKYLSLTGGSDAKSGVTMLYITIPSHNAAGKLAGGIYRSSDRGEHWEPAMGDGLNLDLKEADEYAFGPVAQYGFPQTTNTKPQTVYVTNTSTGYQPPHHMSVYRSDDGGKTWRAVFYSDSSFKGFNIEPDYVVANNGAMDQDPARSFSVDPGNPEVLAFTNDMCCYISADGGKSWKAGHTQRAPGQEESAKDANWLCNGLVVTTTWHYYIDPFEKNRHYIAYTDIGFARSLDAGRSWKWWTKEGRAPWTNTCYEMAFDPDAPGKIWGAFSNAHDIPNKIDPGKDRKGGICVSTDFGATWKASGHGLPQAPALSVVADPKSPKERRTLYAGLFEQGVYKSTDDGKTWTAKNEGLSASGNMRVCRLQLHADGTLFALLTAAPGKVDGAGLYRSRDGAEHWELANAAQRLSWPKDFAVDPKDSQHILIGACDYNGKQEGGLYRSLDGGTTWKRVARKGTETFGAYFSPRHPGWIYMSLCEDPPESGLWLSKDNGETWVAFEALPFGNIHRVEFDPNDERAIYVTTFGGSVWRGPAAP